MEKIGVNDNVMGLPQTILSNDDVAFNNISLDDRCLVFIYCNRKNTSYVDGHKWEDVVLYCNIFCKIHFSAYNP